MARDASSAFKALSDPTRRAILILLRDGDLSAGVIAGHFDISQPSVSHHLAALRSAGLVSCERRGQEIVYSLDTTAAQDLLTFLASMFEVGGLE